jgi:hypothetical protein
VRGVAGSSVPSVWTPDSAPGDGGCVTMGALPHLQDGPILVAGLQIRSGGGRHHGVGGRCSVAAERDGEGFSSLFFFWFCCFDVVLFMMR